jgi:sugar lactone lactonase YvrE
MTHPMRIARTVCTIFCMLASTVASAQLYVISTIAGGAPPPTPPPLGSVLGVVADVGGNVYIASSELNAVFRLDSSGVLTRVAGNSRTGYSGDGGPATNAQITSPQGLALDTAGNLFIADYGNRRIRRVSKDGIITTVAGSGACCFAGDGGPAVNAALATPLGLSVDARGNLFIADEYNHRIRKVSTSGIITTVAGDGMSGFSGDGGPGDKAQLSYPTSVAADRAGNLYIADYNNHRIRMLSADGTLTTVAGNGGTGSSGDGGPAADGRLNWAVGIALDGTDNLYIADSGSVRKVSGGTITTVAGGGTSWGPSGDGPVATKAAMLPRAIAADGAGNLFIADAFAYSNLIREVFSNGAITTIAGQVNAYVSGDGGRAVDARLENPAGVAVDRDGRSISRM